MKRLTAAGAALAAILAAALPPATADTAPRAVQISARQPNRIAFEGSAVANAVYDKEALEVRTDEASGAAYVFAHGTEPTVLFLTSAAGDTAALTLVPGERAARSITLPVRKKPAALPAAAPIGGGLPAVTAAKRLARALILGQIPADCVRTEPGEENSPNGVRATVELRCATPSMEGIVLRLAGVAARPVPLDPSFWTTAGTIASAVSADTLAKGESAAAVVVRQRHE